MKSMPNKKSGIGIVEYLIVVLIVAIGTLLVFGIYGDAIKGKLMGGSSETNAVHALDK